MRRTALIGVAASLIATSLVMLPGVGATEVPGPEPTPEVSEGPTPGPSATPSPTSDTSAAPDPTNSASPSPSEVPTPSPSASPSAAPSASPSALPSASASPSPSPSASPSETSGWRECSLESQEQDQVACPPAPAVSVNEVLATGITVEWSWDAPPSDLEGITDVLIRVSPSDGEFKVPAEEVSTEITELQPQTDYSITAYSIRGQQLSLASTPVRITTPKLKKLADSGDVSRLIVETWSDNNPKAATTAATGDLPVDGVDVADVQDIGNDSVVVQLSSGISDADAAEIVADLESDPRVESVEVDQRVRLTAFPSDPPDDTYWTNGGLWGLYGTYGVGIASGQSSMNNVWTSGQGSGAVVAVLDTGSTVHPDLDSNYVAGYDFVSDGSPSTGGLYGRAGATDSDGDYVNTSTYGALGWDSNPADPGDWDNSSSSSWHGTHVAGTVAAVGNNAQGVIGVAPQAKIQPIRVLTYGGGWTSDIAAGITWASGGSVSGVPANPTPADVINLSLGGYSLTCSSTWQTAIDGAVARGSAVVVSAGNSNDDAANYSPANCNNVITVASSTSSGNRSSFSNYGSTVEITAPGSGIMSTLNSGTTTPSSASYGSYSGTSMAAPHVAGVAALLKAADGSRTPSTILSLLQSTVQTFPATGSAYQCSTSNCGPGLLTAASAVDTDPAIIGISPTGGPTAGSDTVTITGRNLTNTTSVTFGGTAGTGLTVNSSTSVTVTTPAKSAGAVDIVLTSDGITATAVNGYTYYAAPVLTSLDVSSGTLAGGTTVVISGSNLTSTTAVTFGGTTATITDTGASSVTVTTPARSVGAVDVVVTTLGGSDTLASAYEFKAFPVISSYSSDQGSVSGGDTITITGTNLASTTGVTFGGVSGTGISATSTSVSVTTPANSAGLADVAVTNSSGTTTDANAFRYFPVPNATTISTGSGSTSGGTSVTIQGTGFANSDVQDSRWVTVTFGGTAATVWLVSQTSVVVTTPAKAAGTVDVVVSTAGGSSTISEAFTYVAPAPSSGGGGGGSSGGSSSSSSSGSSGGGGGGG